MAGANGPWDPKSDPILKSYAYYYSYDGRGNCIGKKLPGCDSIAMVYDAGDRLVFSQDGNLKKNNLWTFHLYDTFGRLAVTGLCTTPTDMTSFQNAYVKVSLSGTDNTLGGYVFQGSLSLAVNRLLSVNYYDQRGRMVQSHASNHLGGMEDHFMKLTFTGKEILEKHQHSATGKTPHSEVYTYAYDKAERLDTTYYKLDSLTAFTLSVNAYDEVGRLKSKIQGAAVDTACYSYNVRSWLTQITGGRFSQTLTYNTTVGTLTPTTCTFNGNISATCSNAASGTTRGYQFTYDGLNQMTNAVYGEGSTLSTNPNRFTETVTYDKQGNIQTLKRYGKQDSGYGLIDDLNYGYLDINNNKGNQLTKVTDAVSGPLYVGAFHFIDGEKTAPIEYIYDANGNMVQDYNKKIAKIQYNTLNLPDKLQFTYGNTTDYLYDAAGGKLSVTYTTANTNLLVPMGSIVPVQSGNILTTSRTDYCGNVIYEDGVLSRILTEEGYITFSGSNPVYHYYLKDHEGNNRVVLNQSGTVEQVNNYYPFGGLYGDNTGGSVQPYMYNGKELDRMHGLDLFDYGARHYDAALGRWFTVDPLAEMHPETNTYTYCNDNPVNLKDPNGMDFYRDNNGNVLWQEGHFGFIINKGQTYFNIGETYTKQIDEYTSFTYNNQNELATVITVTMTADEWISQFSKSNWNGTPANRACNKACDAMLAEAGFRSCGMVVIVDDDGNGRAGKANSRAKKAINDMSIALEMGIPTKVNIDYKDGSSSADNMGDHFIFIIGKMETVKNGQVTSKTFYYFDPGTHNISKGTSPNNTLNIMNRTLSGTSDVLKSRIVVTSIRPSR